MSRRTKMLLWVSTLPVILVFSSTVGGTIYASYLTRTGQATYFVIVHVHWPHLLAISSALLACALISLFFEPAQ